jgi:Cu+-exporting ATPase
MALEPVDIAPITRVEWTCPMHPEIVRDEPGACPICGMALEPRTVTIEESNPELTDMTRRFWRSALITAPMLAFMVSEFLPDQPLQRMLPHGLMNGMLLALATPVVLWGGWPFFVRGWASVVNRHLNMFTLIALGVGTAYIYSIIATLAPGLFPDSFRTMGWLLSTSSPLRSSSRSFCSVKCSSCVHARVQVRPFEICLARAKDGTAHRRRRNGARDTVGAFSTSVTVLRVKPGERVPVDGVVSDGATTIDESMVTGEPIPVEKTPDASVIGGTVNGTGTFVMEARRVGGDTLLAQIVRMVSDAQRSRAPIQRQADVMSAWFVPIVIAVAAITFAIWSQYGPEPRLAHALVNAVAVLIIACPCALGLATPMSIMVGTGRGAEAGVLIRNAEALELLRRSRRSSSTRLAR